jgi:hypothetical protein
MRENLDMEKNIFDPATFLGDVRIGRYSAQEQGACYIHHLLCVIGNVVKGSEDVALEADVENVWQFLLATQTKFIRAWPANKTSKSRWWFRIPGLAIDFSKQNSVKGMRRSKARLHYRRPQRGLRSARDPQRTMKSQRRSLQGRNCS